MKNRKILEFFSWISCRKNWRLEKERTSAAEDWNLMFLEYIMNWRRYLWFSTSGCGHECDRRLFLWVLQVFSMFKVFLQPSQPQRSWLGLCFRGRRRLRLRRSGRHRWCPGLCHVEPFQLVVMASEADSKFFVPVICIHVFTSRHCCNMNITYLFCSGNKDVKNDQIPKVLIQND